MKKPELWNTTSEKQNSTITLETRLAISSYDPAIILLGNSIKQMQAYVHTKALYNNVHSSFICKNQKLDTVQKLINRSVNKQNMAYSYNVMLFSKKKKELRVATKQMSLEIIHNRILYDLMDIKF